MESLNLESVAVEDVSGDVESELTVNENQENMEPHHNEESTVEAATIATLPSEMHFEQSYQLNPNDILITGSVSWRKDKINGRYLKSHGSLLPTFIHQNDKNTVLILFNDIWFIKIKNKIVCKLKCPESISPCMPYDIYSLPNAITDTNKHISIGPNTDKNTDKNIDKSSEKVCWVERMGVYLPIYNIRPNMKTQPVEPMFSLRQTELSMYSRKSMLVNRISNHFATSGNNNRRSSLFTITEADLENNCVELSQFLPFQITSTVDNSANGDSSSEKSENTSSKSNISAHNSSANSSNSSAKINNIEMNGQELGLSVSLFLRYIVLKVALIDLDCLKLKNNTRIKELTTEKLTISTIYSKLITSIVMNVTKENTGNVTDLPQFPQFIEVSADKEDEVKRTLCDDIQLLLIDMDAQYTVLLQNKMSNEHNSTNRNNNNNSSSSSSISDGNNDNSNTIKNSNIHSDGGNNNSISNNSINNNTNSNTNSSDEAELCFETFENVKNTLKILLFTDSSLVADKIEWTTEHTTAELNVPVTPAGTRDYDGVVLENDGTSEGKV